MSPYLSYIRNLGEKKRQINKIICENTVSIYLTDRGGLLYPSDEFIARLWTIYSFTKGVIRLVEGCTTILKDMVEFLLPKVEKCSTFQCELTRSGESNTELVECLLKKFLMPLLRNNCAVQTVDTTIHIDTNSKNRRLKTLSQ